MAKTNKESKDTSNRIEIKKTQTPGKVRTSLFQNIQQRHPLEDLYNPLLPENVSTGANNELARNNAAKQNTGSIDDEESHLQKVSPINHSIKEPHKDKKTSENQTTLPYPSTPQTTLPQTTVEHPTLVQKTEISSETVKPKIAHTVTEISPSRNFTKNHNSVYDQAIPEGRFKGQSKLTYDMLLHLGRVGVGGHFELQMTKQELCRHTGLEAKTVQRHLAHLEKEGLITRDPRIGDHKGPIYRVFWPHEIDESEATLPQTGAPYPSVDKSSIKRVPNPGADSTSLGQGSSLTASGSNEFPKTSFKDIENNDDEPQARIFAKLEAAARAKTGKGLTEKDYAVFEDAIDLLIAETEVAAARTNSISAYIPFLTENLRRRLHAKPRTEKKGTEPKRDTVGQTYISTPVPLDDEGKLMMLESYKTYLVEFGMEWVDQNEEFFTPEDWQWIKTELAKTEQTEEQS